jgi:threonylcarbamoyladenosine tRNA methylthiotransferase MtaB
MSSLDVMTFGCRLNAHESAVIHRLAQEGGLSDAVIVNTCAVTSEAVRQSRQAIRRARRERPHVRIIATGCAAQIDPDAYAAMTEVDQVIGNSEKLDPASYGPKSLVARIRVAGLHRALANESRRVVEIAGRVRGFVAVQNGCDHRCTFCIIPFGRGRSRSLAPDIAVEQMRQLVTRGIREIVLTGVDISAYGADLPGQPSLGALVSRALRELPDLERLRLSSIDCVEVDETLIRLMAEEERLMPHIHLSLQSGDDLVLKRMKRRHSRRDAIDFCNRLRRLRPDIVFGADLIAGFPTETPAMFDNTLRLVDECAITYLHVFPFSARPGTAAARMPQLEPALVRERAQRLRLLGEARLTAFLEGEVGRSRTVLVEHDGHGHTEHFAPVVFASFPPPGAVVRTVIIAARARHLDVRLTA